MRCWLHLSFVNDSSDLWRLLERPIEERRSWNRCLLIDPTPQLKAALLKNHQLDVLFTRCTAWTRIVYIFQCTQRCLYFDMYFVRATGYIHFFFPVANGRHVEDHRFHSAFLHGRYCAINPRCRNGSKCLFHRRA